MKSETERKKILDQIKEKNIPNSSLYQEFIIDRVSTRPKIFGNFQ